MNLPSKEAVTMRKHRTGNRCCTRRLIRAHGGNIPPAAMGTIVSEVDNLGRHMLHVRWDAGLCAYVFPDEVEIVTW